MPPATVSGVAPTTAVASVTGGSISGPTPYFTVGASHLMAVAQDVDAERHRFAGLIGPVRVIRRHGDGDAAEWLARRLRQRRGHDTGQNGARAEEVDGV